MTERYPRLHGGFIWEWRDHGLLTRTADGIEFYAYGGDFGEVLHDGNFVMDGMLLPDGTPTPSLAEFTKVNQPLLFDLDGSLLSIRSRYHSLSTEDLRFVAVKEVDGHPAAEATIAVPAIPPGERASSEAGRRVGRARRGRNLAYREEPSWQRRHPGPIVAMRWHSANSS